MADVDWNVVAETNPTIQAMVEAGVPMTRENYLDAHYNGQTPEPWTEEHEMSLPPGLAGGVGASGTGGPMPVHPGPMNIGAQAAPTVTQANPSLLTKNLLAAKITPPASPDVSTQAPPMPLPEPRVPQAQFQPSTYKRPRS